MLKIEPDVARHFFMFVCMTVSFTELNTLIPQGTVGNNLGPDRLAVPKALDPNYCRQPTL